MLQKQLPFHGVTTGSWPACLICFPLARWEFGDGGHEIYQFKAPYNESFLMPDPSVHQVVIEHNVSHTYQEPGKLSLRILGEEGSCRFTALRLEGPKSCGRLVAPPQ